MAARWPDPVDELVARIDAQLDEPAPAPPALPTFTAGCPCPSHVLWRALTGHAARASLAPLLPARWRP